MKEQTVPSDNSAAVKEVLEQTDSFRIISDTFRNLGDATRVRIFWLLCHEEKCVIDIASMLEMSSPAVSHHLKALKKSGLIISRREGKEVFYHAGDTLLSSLLHRMIEQVMEIACPDMASLPQPLDHFHGVSSCSCEESCCQSEHQAPDDPDLYKADQLKVIHEIHELLTVHMEKRWTVEELARMYLMNPTTLKDLFRSVYGNSIASHIREHRMERAALLIETTGLSFGEIAEEVGYSSQSKFTAAFKKHFHLLPGEYRRQKQGDQPHSK